MVKATEPGVADEAKPLEPPRLSQGAPGGTAAEKLMGLLPLTVTRKAPEALPGSPPACIWNWEPPGLRFMETSRDRKSPIGMAALPTEVLIWMELRE